MVSGCNLLEQGNLDTPIPTEFLPTAIQLTLHAEGVEYVTITHIPSPVLLTTPTIREVDSNTASVTRPTQITSTTDRLTKTQIFENTQAVEHKETLQPTMAPIITDTIFLTSTLPNAISTPFEISLPAPPVETPPPAIPEANIQIFKLGELSLVTSPIQVSLHLIARTVGIVRIELFGEDGRLLVRQLRDYKYVPWSASRIFESLEFEINGVAELSRLVISVEDQFGRLTDVNSVNLILLSTGMAEFTPTSALWQRIIIQEPQPKALIQGGKLIVSGRTRPNSDKPLRVTLVTEDGRLIGQRLAGASITIPGDYGTFISEVPYTVSDLTFALLTVYEDGELISDIAHLSTVEVILAP